MLGRLFEPLGDLDGDVQGVGPVDHSGDRVTLHERGEAFAVDVFHRDPTKSAQLAGALDGDEVGMLQIHRRVDRADEPLNILGVVDEVVVKDFEGDGLAVADVLRLVNGSGVPLGDHRAHFVVADVLAGQTGGGFLKGARGLHRAGDGLGVGDSREVDDQLGVADLDRVAGFQDVLVDLCAVDERSRRAFLVEEGQMAVRGADLAVHPRDREILQLRVALLAAADRQGHALKDVEDSSLVRTRFDA